jgi:hypothetical protein
VFTYNAAGQVATIDDPFAASSRKGHWLRAVGLVILVVITGCGGQRADPSTPTISPPNGWSVEYATYSPNGERLAVMAFDDEADLRLGLVQGNREIRFLQAIEGIQDYAWMPDSSHLLLAVGKPMGFATLIVTDLEGMIVRTIAPTRSMTLAQSGLTVDPSGAFAVASALAVGGLQEQDLYRIDLETGATERLTRTPAIVESFPLLTEDGTVNVATDRGRSDSALVPVSITIWRSSRQKVYGGPSSGNVSGLSRQWLPRSARLDWRVYRASAGSMEEITSTTGLHWVTSNPSGSGLAGTQAESVGNSGSIVLMDVRSR